VSFADIWDRMYWSFMLIIFVGLVWIKFVEPLGLACVGPGLVVALFAGGIFFYLGVRGKRRQQALSQDETAEE
jgi:hypothetical protein